MAGSAWARGVSSTALGDPAEIIDFDAHSGAAGGGGGGGLQVQAGRRLQVNGVIDASGGSGGGNAIEVNIDSQAQAGGGGAGGGVLLQGPLVNLQPTPGRVDLRGGAGGSGVSGPNPDTVSTGGFGGPGFLRIEALGTAPDFGIESTKILPTQGELDLNYGAGNAPLEDLFSTAIWTPIETGPSGLSGAQSCWIQPDGNFFRPELRERHEPAPGLGHGVARQRASGSAVLSPGDERSVRNSH